MNNNIFAQFQKFLAKVFNDIILCLLLQNIIFQEMN